MLSAEGLDYWNLVDEWFGLVWVTNIQSQMAAKALVWSLEVEHTLEHLIHPFAITDLQRKIRYIIVYWTLTSNTNIRAFAKTNALDIFPYQPCLSRAKSISAVFITWEIHISRVSLYDKFLIIRFERNTIETSLVHCLWHCLLMLHTRKQYQQWTSWYCAQNGQ